jgi:hypothetical protein
VLQRFKLQLSLVRSPKLKTRRSLGICCHLLAIKGSRNCIAFTTSPRADAIRAYKRCASASTRVHRSHNIRRKSNPNRQACQRPLSRVLHPHLLLVVRRLRWACTVRPVSARPASTPLPLTHREPSYPPLQPLKSHQTGSRNPFGVPNAPSPPPLPCARRANAMTGLPNDHFHECCVLICYRWCLRSSSASPSTPSTTAMGSTFSDPVFSSFGTAPTIAGLSVVPPVTPSKHVAVASARASAAVPLDNHARRQTRSELQAANGKYCTVKPVDRCTVAPAVNGV